MKNYLAILFILLILPDILFGDSTNNEEDELVVVKNIFVKDKPRGAFEAPRINISNVGPYVISATFGYLGNNCELSSSKNECEFNIDMSLNDVNRISKVIDIKVSNNDTKNDLLFMEVDEVSGREPQIKTIKIMNEYFDVKLGLTSSSIKAKEYNGLKIIIDQKDKTLSNTLISRWLRRPIPIIIEPVMNIKPAKEPYKIIINLSLRGIESPYLLFENPNLIQTRDNAVSTRSKICNVGDGVARVSFLNKDGNPYVEWLYKPSEYFSISLKNREWEKVMTLNKGDCIELFIEFNASKKGEYSTVLTFEDIVTKKIYNMLISGRRY